jgi:hypothetical protein
MALPHHSRAFKHDAYSISVSISISQVGKETIVSNGQEALEEKDMRKQERFI